MDIGNQLQKARADAGLTQEQVAEALGISRQTLSNWETGKTSPDIKSVVALSELYGVSLDRLGKGTEDIPQEPSDGVQEKKHLPDLKLLWFYLMIWAAGMVVFHLFLSGSDAMGFALLFLHLLLPLISFFLSVIIGMHHDWGWKWLVPFGFGFMWVMAGYCSFNVANMLSGGRFSLPELSQIVDGSLIPLAGMVIGSVVRFGGKLMRRLADRVKEKKNVQSEDL